jgi:hypothetical protein
MLRAGNGRGDGEHCMPDHSHAARSGRRVATPIRKILACLGLAVDCTLALVTAHIASLAATGRLPDFGFLTLLH